MPPKKNDSDFYDTHSEAYYRKTCNVDPTCFLNMLVNQLPKGANILDIGCGSGRNLLWLKKKGYNPTGFERSLDLAEFARQHSQCLVTIGDFTNFDFSDFRFDALLLIGALVHLQYSEILPVFLQISEAIKKDGIICLSLKEGEGKSCSSDGRMFTLWRHDHLEKIYRDHGFSVMDFSRNISAVNSHDVWLSYLLRKEGTD